MPFMKTNYVSITVDDKIYDSLHDFGLAIENTDYIGTPVRSTENLIAVPGRDGLLDTTDAVFGGAYFRSRDITIKFGGIREPEEWDTMISTFRNLFEGKTVKVTFATLPDWYFTGRCRILSFKHERPLGTFTFNIPEADPFMYRECSFTRTATSGGVSVTIPITRKTVSPTIISANNITITKDGTVYPFDSGTHKNPELRLTQGDNILTVKGSGSVTIAYKDGSL